MKANIKRTFWIIIIVLIALFIRAGFEIIFREIVTITQFIDTMLRFLLTAIAVIIWISIVTTSEYSPAKLPWLIFLSFEPFIGLAMFLTFGRDFRKSVRYHNRPLLKEGKYLTKEPVTDFSQPAYQEIDSEITDIFKTAYNMTKHHAYLDDSIVTPLQDGKQMFPTLLHAIEQAKLFIFLQTYILRTDTIGKQILNLLQEKAKNGIEVIVLYDAIGSVFLNRKIVRNLKRSGVTIVPIDPVYFPLFNTRMNYRNHRKVCVVDGVYGFTGGMNIGDEYNNKTNRFGHFRDTHLLIEGNAVNSLTELFSRDYYYSTKELLDDEKYYKATKVSNSGLVQVVPSGPDYKYPPIRNTYVKMINNAKESIKIMTPYLALDQEMITSLITAARADVEISIIVPGIPDKVSIYQITKSFFQELLQSNIHIYTYTPGFCHSKILIIDDKIASCGTYNLDNRSARINFELTVLMANETVATLVEEFKQDLKESKKLKQAEYLDQPLHKRFLYGVFNLFSPLI